MKSPHYSDVWKDIEKLKQTFYTKKGEPAAPETRAYVWRMLVSVVERFASHWNKWHRMVYFLKQEGLWEGYMYTLKDLNIVPDMNSANNFHYLHFLKKKKIIPVAPLRVVEIGAGGGIHPILFSREFDVAHYTIVDLREMLEISREMIKTLAPELYKKCTFLTAEEAERIENFDIAFNFNSFSEMNLGEVARYLALLKTKANSHAVLYTRNYLRGSNNPLLYPYPGVPLVWEEDTSRRAKKGSLRYNSPSLALFRIERFIEKVDR